MNVQSRFSPTVSLQRSQANFGLMAAGSHLAGTQLQTCATPEKCILLSRMFVGIEEDQFDLPFLLQDKNNAAQPLIVILSAAASSLHRAAAPLKISNPIVETRR